MSDDDVLADKLFKDAVGLLDERLTRNGGRHAAYGFGHGVSIGIIRTVADRLRRHYGGYVCRLDLHPIHLDMRARLHLTTRPDAPGFRPSKRGYRD
jgi:hypothetical protein